MHHFITESRRRWDCGIKHKSEWTSEGERKRVTGVWETEQTLRKQGSAYDGMLIYYIKRSAT